MIRRRAVLAAIAGTLASPLVAQTSRDATRRLGVLMANSPNDPVAQAYVAALARGLAALDWREGGNLRIDWRWTGSDPALFERYAAELVASGPDALLAQGSPSVVALKRLSGKSRSCSRWSPIRSDKVLSRAWQTPAATSPASAISIR
jgi:putative ABC transport system substrate-binding protein